jgi:hypothetical protein
MAKLVWEPNGTSQQRQEGKWRLLNAQDGRDSIKKSGLELKGKYGICHLLVGVQMPVVFAVVSQNCCSLCSPCAHHKMQD